MGLLCQMFGTDVGDLVVLRGEVIQRGLLLLLGQLQNKGA